MFDQNTVRKNSEQEEKGGIVVSKLRPGTKLVVKTRNSTYQITIIEGNRVWVKGGKHYPEFIEAYFQGSTWGGTCLKKSWIGHKMYMEFIRDRKILRTSGVRSATIYGPDWSYSMDWSNNDR